MMNDAKWIALQQAEDMAYFRADLCLYSPESFSLEEKRDICNDMMSTSKAVLDTMREDFQQLPPDARAKLLDMLCQSGVEDPQWWWDVLVTRQGAVRPGPLGIWASASPKAGHPAGFRMPASVRYSAVKVQITILPTN